MPSADLLDFDALIAPIPGADPAGDLKDFETLRKTLNDCRIEFIPTDSAPQGFEENQERREPNWVKIQQDTKSALSGKCKHFLYAARLTEALAMTNGFAGIRDGFKLLRLLVEQAWDRLHPKEKVDTDDLDDADKEKREVKLVTNAAQCVAQLNWLGDANSGALFPTKIHMTPMFGAMSWRSWKDGVGDVKAAIGAATTEQCQLIVEDIEAALTELQGLVTATEARVPKNEGPELSEVSRALHDCLALSKQALQEKTGSGGGEIALVDGQPGALTTGVTVSASAGASREQIYEAVNRLADALERLEPHSPVPMLLKKIVTLGPMRFYDLVEALTRDQKVIDFMKPAEAE